MATTKQRASNSAAVSKSAIEQAGLTLQKLPEKPRDTWSLREAVTLLHDSITDALSRGYSHDEVATLLAGKGVSITASSLKRYLATAKREKEGAAKPKAKRTRKPQTTSDAAAEKPKRSSRSKPAGAIAASATATEPSNGASPSASVDKSATSKRRTKTTTGSRSRTSAKTDAKPDETKTAAKSRPTSRAKATPRSTSTRTRKSSNS